MIAQLAIGFTGVVAIWLSQHELLSRRKYACIFGLAGQPFWFYSAYTTDQWGIFVLSFCYTWAWLRGVRNHWFNGLWPGDWRDA